MFVVMQQGATEEQIDAVINLMVEVGFDVHRSTGVIHTVLGGVGGKEEFDLAVFEVMEGVKEAHRIVSAYKLASRNFRPGGTIVKIRDVEIGGLRVVVMAGPCSVESRDQINRSADVVAAAGARVIRGGAFKPRSSPYAFQGLGEAGLKILAEVRAEVGLPVVTEVIDPASVDLVCAYADMLQIGTRSMQNFTLLQAVGSAGKPVLLKRGMNATIEEWLMAAEYIAQRGNLDIVLCERGIRTFETATRNTLDISAVPVAQRLSHLPVIIDPSHSGGRRDLVLPLTRAGIAVGADGIMIDVHPQPAKALCDGDQALSDDDIRQLAAVMHSLPQMLGRTLTPAPEPATAGSPLAGSPLAGSPLAGSPLAGPPLADAASRP